MIKHIFSNLVLASTLGLTSIGATLTLQTPNAYAQEQSTNSQEELANQFIQFSTNADWKSAYNLLGANLQSLLTEQTLSTYWSGFTAPYGKIQDTRLKETKDNGVHTDVTFIMSTENGAYELVVSFDDQNKIDEFSTTMHDPAQPLNPEYHHPENYIEKEVVFGEEEFPLPGVLTFPKGEGPFPVVVLVHGSGPSDMDETAYGFKPFRDIAVGLVNEGIAVLRYDKRTNVHPIKSSHNPEFTIQEETVLDANLAVEKLKTVPGIDPENIYVLGHSQGGYALPLILQNDKNGDIKGGIGVAGPSGKFQDLLLWQMAESLERAKKMNAPQEQIEALEQNLAFFEEQIGLINDPQYSTENIPTNFQLGNAYWWYDLRDYIPTELAKEQDTPLLLLQGGKDIQVAAPELEVWKSALDERDDVQYKLYPDMMHFLSNFSGEPNGITEYMTPGNVPQEFITDIAGWVKTGSIVDLNQFKDYKEDEYWSEAFAWAIGKRIIKGYEDEKVLKPYSPMNESQYLKVFFRLSEKLKDESLDSIYSLAKEKGLPVKGNPYAAFSRGEAAVLLAKSFTGKDRSEKEAIQWLYDQKVVNGYPEKDGQYKRTYESFQPNKAMSRAHLLTMLYRLNQN